MCLDLDLAINPRCIIEQDIHKFEICPKVQKNAETADFGIFRKLFQAKRRLKYNLIIFISVRAN